MEIFKIDQEFRNKIPPLTEEEFKQLEENILSDGEVYEPIIVWNDTIVDGHNRWRIIQKHPELKWTYRRMNFIDKWAAFDWMYKKQLGRRNLTEPQKTYLLGKLYEARKHTSAFKGNQYVDESGRRQNGAKQPGRVREQIMAEQGVGQKTVERAEHFAKGIDAIRVNNEHLAEDILNDKVKVKKIDVITVGQAKPDERSGMIDAIKNGEPLPKRTKKHDGASKKNREDSAQIQKSVQSLTDEVSVDYTIDHLEEQIKLNSEAFIRALTNLLTDHADMCKSNKERITSIIENSVTKEIEKIIIQIKE